MASDQDITALMGRGLNAHRSGDIAVAKSCYEAALSQNPNHPEALHLLGLIQEQSNNRDVALELIGRAIAINPKEPLFRLNIAAILEKSGKFHEAAVHLEQAAAITPGPQDILMRLGAMLVRSGQLEKAANVYTKLVELNPTNYDALLAYSSLAMQLGNAEESLRVALYILSKNKRNPTAYVLASNALSMLRRWRALVSLSEQWHAELGEKDGVDRMLATAYYELEEHEKAREAYEALLLRNPNSLEILSTYARFCVSILDYKKAHQLLERALSLEPKDIDSLFSSAKLNMIHGDTAKAKSLCEDIFQIQPEFAPAYPLYVKLSDADVPDKILTTIVSLSEKKSVLDEHLGALCFSAGDIYHKRENYVSAINEYGRGNKITSRMQELEGLIYSPEQNDKLRKQELQFFDFESVKAEYEKAPVVPVFIVGMPRTGSTLSESILAAHPDVFGCGELHGLRRVHAKVIKRLSEGKTLSSLTPEELVELRRQYFDSLPDYANAKYVVDKQLTNFRSLGLIRALFPEARIINVRRNPIETGFSIYKHHFEKVWLYATDFKDIAHAYGVYAKTISQWEARLGEHLIQLQYEELTSNFEAKARYLVEACGLEWSNECLEFYLSKRDVATFSATQVRKPIQKKRTTIVDQYGEEVLLPLIDGLKSANVDLETGAYIGS